MAQNITIAGASYSAVPSIQVPKTGSGTATFVDTSDADATAAGIMSGLTAYVNGIKLTGTASGGLEYETGTWSPTNSTNQADIYFNKTHDTPPTIIVCRDNSTSSLPSSCALAMGAIDYTRLGISQNDDGVFKAYRTGRYRSSGSTTGSTTAINHGGVDTGDSDSSYWRYWASTTKMHVWCNNSVLWQSTRTYTWIAIWTDSLFE